MDPRPPMGVHGKSRQARHALVLRLEQIRKTGSGRRMARRTSHRYGYPRLDEAPPRLVRHRSLERWTIRAADQTEAPRSTRLAESASLRHGTDSWRARR